jgi:predicted  nucleic acid-binding Zn ribbon protein
VGAEVVVYLTRIRFGTPPRGASADFGNLAEEHLAALARNDQIAQSWMLRDHRPPLEAYVSIPRAGALAARNHSPWARETLRRLRKAGLPAPSLTALEEPPRRPPSWRDAKTLYLATDALDDRPPLRAGDTGEAIPLYTTPLGYDQRGYVVDWAAQVRDHDRIWIDSGALEIPAYRELVDPRSDLAKLGLECRAWIEAACGKPTYYFLPRYYAHRRGEEDRPCPSCGKPWLVRQPEAAFRFRCHPCRLVSRSGVSETEGARLARIGDFPATR